MSFSPWLFVRRIYDVLIYLPSHWPHLSTPSSEKQGPQSNKEQRRSHTFYHMTRTCYLFVFCSRILASLFFLGPFLMLVFLYLSLTVWCLAGKKRHGAVRGMEVPYLLARSL